MIQDFSDGYCITETCVIPYTARTAAVATDYYREICEATETSRVVAKIGSNHVEVVPDGAMPGRTLAVPYALLPLVDDRGTILFARQSGLDVLTENGLIGENGPI